MGHHYVPQKYLQGFATPGDQTMIWQFDKKTSQFSEEPVSIKRVAQQREFYDPVVEDALAKHVEMPANVVLDRLRQGESLLDISVQERASLAIYMATMMYRVPRHREHAMAMIPEVLSDVVTDLKLALNHAAVTSDLPEAVRIERVASREAEIDDAHARLLEHPPDDTLEQVRTPWPSDEVIELIYSHNWYLVEAVGPSFFITGDNPVFMFECYGLKNEDSELTFPISPRLALFGTWRPIHRSHKPERSKQLVHEANRRVIRDSTRFIFCSTRQSWIPSVASKLEPRLNRIV